MGQFPHFIAYKSAGDLSATQMALAAESMLQALFDSIGVQVIQDASGSYSIEEAAKALPLSLVAQLASEQPAVENVKLMRALRISGDGVSAGISFSIDGTKNPSSRWNMFLRKSPLPTLEMKTYHGCGFKPLKGIEEALVAVEAVAWTDGPFGIGGKTLVGAGYNVYLLRKWLRLFSKARYNATESSILAGLRLRELCRDVWGSLAEGQEGNIYRLRSSQTQQKDFEQRFDKALIAKLGAEKIGVLLDAMSCDLERWRWKQ